MAERMTQRTYPAISQHTLKNRTLYHGDNLDFMRRMNSNSVHLIATDPPFNKGKDFHATPDSLAKGGKFEDRWSWDKDVHPAWKEQVQDDWPAVWFVIEAAEMAHSEGMAAFICWLAVRVLEMHRILRDDGTLWLHCDDTAGAYIIAMLDAIFGKKNRGDIVTWKRQNSHNATVYSCGRICDTLLRYTKNKKLATWNMPRVERSEAELKLYRPDKNGRLFKGQDLTAPSTTPSRIFTWRGTTPKRGWRYSYEELERLWAEGRILTKQDGTPSLAGHITYLDEMDDPKIQNLWTDIERLANNSKERTGYPTQKPIELYRRLIDASSNPGDVVFDPFCGCATTLAAAEQAGRLWIGADIWDKAHLAVLVQLYRLGLNPGSAEYKMSSADLAEHMELERQTSLWFNEFDVNYTQDLPNRTDAGDIAAPFLKVIRRGMKASPEAEDASAGWSKDKKKAYLLDKMGECSCAGCGRNFDHPDYLEVDHIRPRADGGANSLYNLTLLCRPCNSTRRKGDKLTLGGLRNLNRKTGFLVREIDVPTIGFILE